MNFCHAVRNLHNTNLKATHFVCWLQRKLKLAIILKILRYGLDMNINFDGDLRTDSEEEEEEISDIGTVNPCWQNAP